MVNETAKNEKLKILALHGYRQNATTFRQKTGSFRKIVNKWAEFVFITAPHKVLFESTETANLNIEQSTDDEQYGWFFNREDQTYRGIRIGGPAIGFETSVKLIENVFEEQGPFDGVWGFSQGACFVGLLCALQQKGLLKTNFKFAIMFAGFKSNSIPHSEFYKEKLTIPSLHVFGATDQIIPFEMSKNFTEHFQDPIILEHPGGHFVPASSELKTPYRKFFENFHLNRDEATNNKFT